MSSSVNAVFHSLLSPFVSQAVSAKEAIASTVNTATLVGREYAKSIGNDTLDTAKRAGRDIAEGLYNTSNAITSSVLNGTVDATKKASKNALDSLFTFIDEKVTFLSADLIANLAKKAFEQMKHSKTEALRELSSFDITSPRISENSRGLLTETSAAMQQEIESAYSDELFDSINEKIETINKLIEEKKELSALKEELKGLIKAFNDFHVQAYLPGTGSVENPYVLALLSCFEKMVPNIDNDAVDLSRYEKMTATEILFKLEQEEQIQRDGSILIDYSEKQKQHDHVKNIAFQFLTLATKCKRAGSVFLIMDFLLQKDSTQIRTDYDNKHLLSQEDFETIKWLKTLQVLIINGIIEPTELVNLGLLAHIEDPIKYDHMLAQIKMKDAHTGKLTSKSLKAIRELLSFENYVKASSPAIKADGTTIFPTFNTDYFNELKSQIKGKTFNDAAEEKIIQLCKEEVTLVTSQLNKAFSSEIFAEVRKLNASYPFLIRHLANLFSYMCYYVMFWIIGRCINPLIEGISSELFRFIKSGENAKNKGSQYAQIENWLLKGIRSYLDNLRDAYSKATKDKDKGGTLEERIEDVLSEVNRNHGLTQDELYNQLGKVLVEKLFNIPIIKSIFIKVIEDTHMIKNWVEQITSSNVDEKGFNYAMDKFFIKILEQVKIELQKKPKKGSSDRTPHSERRKQQLKNLTKSLLKTIDLHNAGDIELVKEALSNPSNWFDSTILFPVAGIAADVMALGLEDTLQPSFLMQTAEDLLSICTQSFVPGEEISIRDKQIAEQKISQLSHEIMDLAIDKGINQIVPMMSDLDENQFTITEIARIKSSIQLLINDLKEIVESSDTDISSSANTEESADSSQITPPIITTPASTVSPTRDANTTISDKKRDAMVKRIKSYLELSIQAQRDIGVSNNATTPIKQEVDKLHDEASKVVNIVLQSIKNQQKKDIYHSLDLLETIKVKNITYINLINPIGKRATRGIKQMVKSSLVNKLNDKVTGLFDMLKDPTTIRFCFINQMVAKPVVSQAKKG